MSLRRSLHRLERAYQGGMITTPLKDGTVARFPRTALREAYLSNMDALRARADGDDPPEPHPLCRALQNAVHCEPWHETFFDMFEDTGAVPDLSEP